VLQRKGNYAPPPGASDLPGLEVAGEIVGGDAAAGGFAIGDKVCALVAGGGYAEYVVAPAPQCLPIPRGLTEIEAAGLPETYFPVWSNVFDRGRLAAGEALLVHGGASGIGTTAIQLARAMGNKVYATVGSDERARAVEALGAALGINYKTQDYVKEVLDATGGTLDALFNNGAFGMPGAVEDVPTEALRAIFETNFFGWHELTRRVIPVMRAQGHGRIVQCSSVLGLVAFPWRGAYVATKYALEGLSDTLRLELADTGIHVVLIEPGPITSKLREKAIPHFERHIDWQGSALRAKYEGGLLKRLYEDRGPDRFELPPSAVTAKLIHALEARRPRPRYYVTTPTYIAGILRRILPTRLSDRVLGRI